LTEEIAATPGWVDDRLDAILSGVPALARTAYADCLARAKQPGAPSDLLGTEFGRCRAVLRQAVPGAAWYALVPKLEALEAEIAAES